MTKKYSLEVTETQLQVISTACELLARIQGGQIREAFEHLPLRKETMNWEAYHEIQDELTKRMPEILEDGINGYNSSFGVGSSKVHKFHDVAWDLHQVIRYELSTEKAIEEGLISKKGERDWNKMMTVNFDTPMKYSEEPLAKVQKLNIDT